MRRIRRLLLVSFLESFATICVERGIYFFTTARLGFSEAGNLALAICFGLAYFVAAFASHPITSRLGPGKVLRWSIVLVLLAHLALGGWMAMLLGRFGPGADNILVFAVATAIGALTGLKWPIIESYVSAGFTPSQTFQVVGRFSLSWAGAVPLAVALAGPMIALHASVLFLVPAVLNAAALVLIRNLPGNPVHLPDDHPARPDPARLKRMRTLLSVGRLHLISSYCFMWILAAIVPNILEDRFLLAVAVATAVAAILEASRLAAFVSLTRFGSFCDSIPALLVVTVTLPIGFVVVLFAPNLPVLIVGEIVFGLSAGVIYYASLYHALVVKNAAVSAGGAHEGLIGLGFAAGPIFALLGLSLPGVTKMTGLSLGVAAVTLPCLLLAGRKLLALRTTR